MRLRTIPAFLLILGCAFAQKFEVASIKHMATTDHRVMIRMAPGGRFTADGVTVKLLIAQAYQMKDFQISGGPGWINSDRFEVNAKAEDSGQDRIPPEKLQAMLRSLLEERFGLKVRQESKELPVYVLLPGKNGPRLTRSEIQPEAAPPAGPPPPGGPGQVGMVRGGPGGGMPGGGGGMMRMGRGMISAKGVPVAMLARQLSQALGREVIDKTGLTGNFDIDLKWTPEPGQSGGGPPMDGPPGAVETTDAGGPTVFTALQEQLGLKLESQKGTVPTLVIEAVSKPTEN